MSMMNIELLKKGWMTTSGSSLLRMMQNVSTPVLDLIVRESLQNSLDAAKKTLTPKKDRIRVDFRYDSFNSKKLADEFEGISQKLHEYDNLNTKYISISDTNTVGLTGHLNGIFDPEEKDQHLGKLVFQIMKPQDNEGAGGSWGIGKTVYYRLGIGLIIYYSRIKCNDGNFEDRLVAALVEDENKKDGLLGGSRFKSLGTAFFGERKEDGINNLQAITNKNYIKDFLSIFKLNVLDGDKTGTTIIIPYIDEEKALNDNLPENEGSVWWCNSIDEYLKVSIARWYFPRLSKEYSYGCNLLATINGEPINFDNEIPIFRKFKDLYDAAFSDNCPQWIKKIPIIRERNLNERVIGWFLYAKLNKSEFMPNNLPDVYSYCQIRRDSEEYNLPIIGYCRKPGMITSYKNDIQIKTSTDEQIIGLFVLNSNNYITSPIRLNLDEYLRRSEKSDHMYWFDHNIAKNKKQVAIVGNIKNQIKKELERAFGDNVQLSGEPELNTVLAHIFGKKFMPDEGYGTNHSRNGSGGQTGTILSHRNNSIKLIDTNYTYSGVLLIYKITINNKIKSLTITNEISTVGKACDANKWEELGMNYPTKITDACFMCESLEKKKVNRPPILLSKCCNFEFFKLTNKKTSKGTVFGFKMDVIDSFKPIEFLLKISFNSVDKMIQSTFNFNFEEE